MGLFRFKQFEIIDDLAGMKVGTDAVLLGSWANPASASCILDIGTGSGILSLMMAQKSSANITGIEIDEITAQQATRNIESSPWQNRISIITESFQNFISNANCKFDFIISNPPYFSNSLKPSDNGKKLAKHTDSLSYQELIHGVSKILTHQGQFYVIIPFNNFQELNEIAMTEGLYINKSLRILNKPESNPIRIILQLEQCSRNYKIEEEIYIRTPNNSFSDDYKNLTKDFYLNF